LYSLRGIRKLRGEQLSFFRNSHRIINQRIPSTSSPNPLRSPARFDGCLCFFEDTISLDEPPFQLAIRHLDCKQICLRSRAR
jgi:hypothetical protein